MAVLSGPQVAAVCKRAGWTGENLVIAIAVAKAESGWRTDATNKNTNGSVDRGLMQINTIHRWSAAQNMFDPQINANAGMRIWREAGNRWRPWSTFNAGRHLRYMNEARAAAAGAGNVTGPIGGDTQAQTGITYGPPGPRIVVAGPAITLAAELDRPGKLGVFQFIGGKLSETFDGEVVGTIEYEQGISTIPNCEISIIDPEGVLFKKLDALWYRGTTVRYIDMDMTVNEVKFEGGDAGTGMITVKLIDTMVYKMMQLQGARTANNISATEWLAQECKLAGMDPNKMFLGESVPSQSVIARQVEQEEQAAGAAATTAAPATGVSGTVRYDGTNPRLDTDGTQAPPFSDPNRQNQTSLPGLNAITTPYVVVDNASQLRKQYLIRNITTGKQVVAIGGDIGHGFGEISYAAAQALGMNIRSNAMPAHHIIISDYTGTGTTQAAAATAAPATVTDGAGNKVLPDVAGTTAVPSDSSKLIPDKRSEGKTDAPSGWSTGTVLAKELGKRYFVTGNRMIFGSAGFCLQFARPLDQNEYLGWGGYSPGNVNRFLSMPEVERVAVGKREGVIQIKGKILNLRAAYLRSGSSVLISGVPGVADGRFMVSKVKHSLGTDIDGADIEMLQPVNPPPEPPQTGGGGNNAAGGAITGGTGSIDKFISLMLAQTGDRYVFGISVNRNDPNPSAFDCAELTSWAAWQAGIRPYLIPGSQAQRAQCKRFRQISVNQAINTKGALLFTGGHVAASLGNGRTIEAYQTGKPVGSLNARGRGWADAALIPGAAGYRLGAP